MAINKFITGALTAGALAFSAGAASAVTFVEDAQFVTTGSGTVTANSIDLDTSIDFDWTLAPVTQYISFTVDKEFDLFFTDYNDNNSPIDRIHSAFTFDLLDGADGNVVQRLTTQFNACNQAEGPIAGVCTPITDLDAFGNVADDSLRPSLDTPVFADLAAGSYRLGIYERSLPNPASASFAVAAVPLPAGLVLILSGLGIMGLIGRRRTV